MGVPQRVLLSPGDAVLAHQRLAHCAGLNLSAQTRKNLYFRVEHEKFPSFAKAYACAEFPWMGFSGLTDYAPPGSTQTPDSDNDGDSEDEENIPEDLRSVLAIRGCALGSLSLRAQKAVQLSVEQKETFVTEGMLVLRNIVTPELLKKAVEKVNRAHVNQKFRYRPNQKFTGCSKGAITFGKHVCSAPALTNILSMSGLVTAAESLLGYENVVLLGGTANVVYMPQSDMYPDEGKKLNFCAAGFPWRLGFSENGNSIPHSNHFLTICVVISNKSEKHHRETVLAWPGT